MNSKPRIFIASSTEHIRYAHAVHMFLNNKYAHTKLWEISIEPGEYTLPALYRTFHEYEYGIFIFSPDDIVEIRGRKYATSRDNVLFEFGMFIGINGLDNAFILTPVGYLDGGRIPSDLFGITIATFDERRPDNELKDAISSSCLIIMEKIMKMRDAKAQNIPTEERSFIGILEYEGDMLSMVVDMLSNAQKKVSIVITSQERLIVFDLITSILYARLNSVEIEVHYYPLVKTHTNSYSIEIFRQLGCNVIEYEVGIAPENVLFVADPNDLDFAVLVVKTERYSRRNVYAFYHKGHLHAATITSYAQTIKPIDKIDEYMPTLVKVSEDELLNSFKKIRIYTKDKCKFSIIKLKPKEVMPQSFNFVKEYKLKQALLLLNIFTEYKFDLYEPIAILLKNGIHHYIVPPVVEEHKGLLLIAEGHTRFFNHLESNIPIISVLVKGMKTPLPSEPTNWEKVKVAPYTVPKDFIPSPAYLERIRKIEVYLHKGDWFSENS